MKAIVRVGKELPTGCGFGQLSDGTNVYIPATCCDRMYDLGSTCPDTEITGLYFSVELKPNPEESKRDTVPHAVARVVALSDTTAFGTQNASLAPTATPTPRARTPLETIMDALLGLVGGDGSEPFSTLIPTENEIALVVMRAIPPTDPSFALEVKRLMTKATMLGLKHKINLLALILGMEKVMDTILAEGIGALPPVTLDELTNGEERYANSAGDESGDTIVQTTAA